MVSNKSELKIKQSVRKITAKGAGGDLNPVTK
jgi:hypothetical protein